MNSMELRLIQQELTRVWQDVLEVSEIAPQDDFFDLGGHSLIAIEIREQLRKLFHAPHLKVSLLEFPTIALMTESIGSQLKAATPKLVEQAS